MNNAWVFLTVGLITFGLRALPFVLFAKYPMPLWLIDLSKRIPVMILGLLVIYALKDTRFSNPTYGIPEGIALAIVIGLQLKFRNALLSILLSTLTYIVLLQVCASSF
jgi:branched-subunit amino acid transport protein AzlD